MSIQHTKQKQARNLPTRNTPLEAFIYLGAIGLFGCTLGTILFWFIANAFNDTGNASVGPLTILILGIGGLLATQAVLIIRQRQRVDRYWQRLVALGMILLFPILLALMFTGLKATTRTLSIAGHRTVTYTSHPYSLLDAITSGPVLTMTAIASVAGMIWLWVLLLRKDKLFWELKGNHRTKEYKQRAAKIGRNKKLGGYLIAVPLILFAIYVYTALSAGVNGGNTLLYELAAILRTILFYVWTPSIVGGMIVLIRNN